MRQQFYSTLFSFNGDSFQYGFTNPFTKRARLPRVVTRYGGKGNFYMDYEPYVYDMAKKIKAKNFIDFFGGGGTMSMMALLMYDYDTAEPLFENVIYNDLDISTYCTFKTVKCESTCDELVEKILTEATYDEQTFRKAHKNIALINVSIEHLLEDENYLKDASKTEFEKLKKEVQLQGDYYDEIMSAEYKNYKSKSYREQAEMLQEAGKKRRNDMSEMDIAYYAFVENALSFNGAGCGFRNTDNYERNNVDYEKKMYLRARKLMSISPLLERLTPVCGSYENLLNDNKIKSELDRSVLFFDPPYMSIERSSATDIYKHEMSDDEHRHLINDYLKNLNHWLLCGYKQDEQDGDKLPDALVDAERSRVYGVLREFPNVEFIDLGAKARPSSSKAIGEVAPHEILWLRP